MRGFIRREGRYAMIHSGKYGEYKFPGGGAKPWEQLEDTLYRIKSSGRAESKGDFPHGRFS